MRFRTTFSLDRITMDRLKKLSKRWEVSQAEVVRRALSYAESSIESESTNPVDMLKRLHQEGQSIDLDQADKYLAETRKARRDWRQS